MFTAHQVEHLSTVKVAEYFKWTKSVERLQKLLESQAQQVSSPVVCRVNN